MIIYFTFFCLFYLKSLCLMRALVKIGFYYHKQHSCSDVQLYIYFFILNHVYIFPHITYVCSGFIYLVFRWAPSEILYFNVFGSYDSFRANLAQQILAISSNKFTRSFHHSKNLHWSDRDLKTWISDRVEKKMASTITMI